MKLHEITILEEASRCLMCYDAPCSKACPAASDPASFVKAIRLDNRRGGARQALKDNIFGGICSATCLASKYCEGACIRGKIDRPVDIAMLHSYIAQYADECSFSVTQDKSGTNLNQDKKSPSLKVVVLGANMAGLAAAAELAKNGVMVTVFADGPFWGEEVQIQLSNGKIESGVLESGLSKLKELGVELLPAGNMNALIKKKMLPEYDFIVIASKKSLTDFQLADNSAAKAFAGAIFTGELVTGPNDATYSVKKGKEAAKRVLEFAKEGNK